MQEKSTVVVPIVHLNGDSAKTLIQNLETVYDALSVAYKALREVAPHQRNFYPQPGLYEDYMKQHRARLQALHDLQESLIRELEGIQAQDPRRIL